MELEHVQHRWLGSNWSILEPRLREHACDVVQEGIYLGYASVV